MSRTHGPVVELKALDGTEREIKGYGSVFWNVDSYGDVILPGAFTRSLARRAPLMLDSHDTSKVIGRWDVFREDQHGLYLAGRLADTPRGNEIYTLLRMGATQGLEYRFPHAGLEAEQVGWPRHR